MRECVWVRVLMKKKWQPAQKSKENHLSSQNDCLNAARNMQQTPVSNVYLPKHDVKSENLI